jgi:tetratricopeptide (TPR) repeat protein
MNEVTRVGNELGMDEPTLFGMTHFANTLAYLTRFDEALRQAELTLKRAEELGNLKYQAQLLTFVIPVCRMRNGDMVEALAALERGIEIAQRIGDRESEVFAATLQGKVAMAQGAYEEALALFRRTVAASEATGIPYMRALGLCVTGTCYEQLGGPMLEEGLEYHRQTAEVMDLPTGGTLGAWLWSEMGACALSAGDIERAKSLFDRALNEKSAPMHLMRPLALQGACAAALAEGRVGEAGELFAELEEYVQSRQRMDQYAPLALLGATVEAASGNHEAALAHFEECDQIASAVGMKRLELELHAGRARSLDALGRDDQAAQARDAGRRVMDEIAAGFENGELRGAFLTGARQLLAESVAG